MSLLYARHFAYTMRHLIPSGDSVIPATGARQMALATAGSGFIGIFPRLPLTFASVMFALLLLLMTIELGASYWTLTAAERRVFMWEREIIGKFLLIVLVVLSLVLDVVIFVAANTMPDHFELLKRGALWVTMTTLLWLLAAEISRILRIVGSSAGEENVPPTLAWGVDMIRWVVRNMRKIDKARWQEKHGTDSELPRRWIDDLTDEEAAIILQQIQKRGVNEVAQDPKSVLPEEQKP